MTTTTTTAAAVCGDCGGVGEGPVCHYCGRPASDSAPPRRERRDCRTWADIWRGIARRERAEALAESGKWNTPATCERIA